MKTPTNNTKQVHKPIPKDFTSPSLEDLIKYEQLGKKLQSDAFYFTYKAIQTWLLHLIHSKKSIK